MINIGPWKASLHQRSFYLSTSNAQKQSLQLVQSAQVVDFIGYIFFLCNIVVTKPTQLDSLYILPFYNFSILGEPQAT